MKNIQTNDQLHPVAAVCGRIGYIYGEVDQKTGIRPLLYKREFAHHGAALLWARDYDDSTKRSYK